MMPPKTRTTVTPPVVTVRKKPKKQDPGLGTHKPDTKSPPVQHPKAATRQVPQSPPQPAPRLQQAPQPELLPPLPAEQAPSPAVDSTPGPRPLNRRQREFAARQALLTVFQARWP